MKTLEPQVSMCCEWRSDRVEGETMLTMASLETKDLEADEAMRWSGWDDRSDGDDDGDGRFHTQRQGSPHTVGKHCKYKP